jgi:hypothetical protein
MHWQENYVPENPAIPASIRDITERKNPRILTNV